MGLDGTINIGDNKILNVKYVSCLPSLPVFFKISHHMSMEALC